MSDGSALLESIRMYPTELTPKLLYLDWAQENPDAVRALIQSALEMVPRLALFGVGLGRGYDDLEPDPKRREELFAESQRELLGTHDGFAAAMAWLAARRPTRSTNDDSPGYALLAAGHWHMWGRDITVRNGSFIAAILRSPGFPWGYRSHRSKRSLDMRVGISTVPPGEHPRQRKPTKGI